MKLVDQFDLGIILCLDERMSDWNDVARQFTSRGLPVELFVAGKGNIYKGKYDHIDIDALPPRYNDSVQYDTWFRRPNALNAFLCHQKMLLRAKSYNLDSVLFIEDDTVLSDDFDPIFDLISDDLDWDLLYLGAYNKYAEKSLINKNLLRVNGAGGLHCVGIKSYLFDEMLSYPARGPMDWQLGKFAHPKLNVYSVYPSIANQKSGFSYVEGHNLEKPARDEL